MLLVNMNCQTSQQHVRQDQNRQGNPATTNRVVLAFSAMFESIQLSNNILRVAKLLLSFPETFLVSMGTPLKYDKLDWALN